MSLALLAAAATAAMPEVLTAQAGTGGEKPVFGPPAPGELRLVSSTSGSTQQIAAIPISIVQGPPAPGDLATTRGVVAITPMTRPLVAVNPATRPLIAVAPATRPAGLVTTQATATQVNAGQVNTGQVNAGQVNAGQAGG